MSDDELNKLIVISLNNHYGETAICGPEGQPTLTHRITKDVVAKPSPNLYEGPIMQYVANHTSIRVPTFRRLVKFGSGCPWVVMDYVEGETLAFLWPTLHFFEKCRIFWILRGYVRQLRKVKLPSNTPPGPFDGSGNPVWCTGFWFPEPGAGPFPTMEALKDYFQENLLIGLLLDIHDGRPVTSQDKALKFDDSGPLVLTHGDISH